MSCELDRIKELIPLYIDDELSEKEKLLVEEHIAVCEECKEELEFYKSMKQEFEMPEMEVPEDFHEELMSKIKQKEVNENKNQNSNNTIFLKFYRNYKAYMNMAAIITIVLIVSFIGADYYKDYYMQNENVETSTQKTREITKEASPKIATFDVQIDEAKVDTEKEMKDVEIKDENMNFKIVLTIFGAIILLTMVIVIMKRRI